MDESKIVAALITASVALALGLISTILNVIFHFSNNRQAKKIEELKSELEKQTISFKEGLEIEKQKNLERMNAENQILSKLQLLKDNCYMILAGLNQNNLQERSIVRLQDSLNSIIDTYQNTYFKVNVSNKRILHDLKHQVSRLEYSMDNLKLKLEKAEFKSDYVPKEDLTKIVNQISMIQNFMLTDEDTNNR